MVHSKIIFYLLQDGCNIKTVWVHVTLLRLKQRGPTSSSKVLPTEQCSGVVAASSLLLCSARLTRWESHGELMDEEKCSL